MSTLELSCPASAQSATGSGTSAASQVLQSFSRDELGIASGGSPARAPSFGEFSFHVVNDLKSRKQAYALAYQVYREKGYLCPHAKQWVVHAHDTEPQTFTVLAKDKNGRPAGTATLYFDSRAGLPADRVFSRELQPLRDQGRRITEVTRLAMGQDYRNSKPLLLGLFNIISIFARRIRKSTDFVIEVHPRHVNFYKRLLCFEERGLERPCPHVQGSPANLLRLNLAHQVSEIERQCDIKRKMEGSKRRNLYARFVALDQEPVVAKDMDRQWEPMSVTETLYFDVPPLLIKDSAER